MRNRDIYRERARKRDRERERYIERDTENTRVRQRDKDIPSIKVIVLSKMILSWSVANREYIYTQSHTERNE